MDQSETSPVSAGSVEPPRGAFDLHLDEKARLKLPAAFQRYLEGIGDKDVFITSLNRKVARIYPMSVWRKNEQFLSSYKADPKARNNVQVWAQYFGGESDVDSSGRVVIPSRLRDALGLAPKATVWLLFENQTFSLYSDTMFQEILGFRGGNLDADVEHLQADGFI
jgi:DNA-binding transcriptional regulator/RsmH inhibitor MraZ